MHKKMVLGVQSWQYRKAEVQLTSTLVSPHRQAITSACMSLLEASTDYNTATVADGSHDSGKPSSSIPATVQAVTKGRQDSKTKICKAYDSIKSLLNVICTVIATWQHKQPCQHHVCSQPIYQKIDAAKHGYQSSLCLLRSDLLPASAVTLHCF